MEELSIAVAGRADDLARSKYGWLGRCAAPRLACYMLESYVVQLASAQRWKGGPERRRR